jgi:hypothetical protein
MARILALLSLLVGYGVASTAIGSRPDDDRSCCAAGHALRSPIGPFGRGDCAYDREVDFALVSAVRADDSDENDSEDDVREVGEPPRSLVRDRDLFLRTLSDPSAFVSRSAAPTWRIPLLC